MSCIVPLTNPRWTSTVTRNKRTSFPRYIRPKLPQTLVENMRNILIIITTILFNSLTPQSTRVLFALLVIIVTGIVKHGVVVVDETQISRAHTPHSRPYSHRQGKALLCRNFGREFLKKLLAFYDMGTQRHSRVLVPSIPPPYRNFSTKWKQQQQKASIVTHKNEIWPVE